MRRRASSSGPTSGPRRRYHKPLDQFPGVVATRLLRPTFGEPARMDRAGSRAHGFRHFASLRSSLTPHRPAQPQDSPVEPGGPVTFHDLGRADTPPAASCFCGDRDGGLWLGSLYLPVPHRGEQNGEIRIFKVAPQNTAHWKVTGSRQCRRRAPRVIDQPRDLGRRPGQMARVCEFDPLVLRVPIWCRTWMKNYELPSKT
jgi:hypothetical protein